MNRAITAFHTLRTEDSRIRVTDALVTASVMGLGAGLASNCDIRYEGNTVEAWQFGVDLSQPATLDPEGWVPSQPSRFMVARNTVRLTQHMPIVSAGIRAIDDLAGSPDGRRLEAWVANDDVTVTGPLGGMRFGIRLIGSEGARLVNNSALGVFGLAGVLPRRLPRCSWAASREAEGLTVHCTRLVLRGCSPQCLRELGERHGTGGD